MTKTDIIRWSFVLLVACGLVLAGCTTVKNALTPITEHALAQDGKKLLDALNPPDLHRFYNDGLPFVKRVAILRGARTVAEEFSSECVSAMQAFYDDPEIGEVLVLRNSWLMANVPSLKDRRAMMFGPDVMLVQRGEPLEVVHEARHRQDWLHAEESFIVQYFTVNLFYPRTAYRKSLIEEHARDDDARFQRQHGSLCEDGEKGSA